MARHTNRSVKSSKANKSRHPRRVADTRPSPPMRMLLTAVGLVGAIALAGLAAWMLIEPASADSAASRTPATAAADQQTPAPAPAPTSVPTPTPTPTPTSTRQSTSQPRVAAKQSQQAQPDQAQPEQAPPQQGQQAFIDPTTGQLRPAEHDDAAALRAAAQSAGARRLARTAAAPPQEFDLPGGGVGIAAPDETMTFTVATRTADGRVVIEHATGPTKAKALVRARTANKTNGHGKEERNDR